jgi:hypothetical protein
MELVFIFAVGWVASHVFAEKSAEYSASQEAHRDKYLSRLHNEHPSWSRARKERYLQNAARRNAFGHFAYLLRHGWSSTFSDIGDGWKKAKAAHEEWSKENPRDGERPSRWRTLKAGWKDRWDRRPKASGYYEARPDLTPDKTDAATGGTKGPDDTPPDGPGKPDAEQAGETQKGDAEVVPIRPTKTDPTCNAAQTPGDNAGSTNGSTAVEYNFDASKTVVGQIGEDAIAKASTLEQVSADAMAGGLSADNESMSHLAGLQEALSNVTALSSAFVSSLDKHQGGKEYADSGHAAKTEYVKSS